MCDLLTTECKAWLINQAKNNILASSGKVHVSETIEEEINKIIDVICTMYKIEKDEINYCIKLMENM